MKPTVTKPFVTRFRKLYEQVTIPLGQLCLRIGLTPDMLTLLSLCWFPLANPPLIRDLGGQLDRPFVEARKRHVVALLRAGLNGGRRR